MDYKNFIMEYFNNAQEGFHIQKVHNAIEAKKMHTHEYFQIYYIEKGALTHYVEDSFARLVVGDMFIIPPGAKHRIEEEKDTVFYSLSFMLDSLTSGNKQTSFAINFLNDLINNKQIRSKISLSSEEVLNVENIIEQIYKEFENKKIAFGEIIKSYILVLVSIFARTYFENSPAIIKSQFDDINQFMLHCVDYIENYYYQNIDLENIVKISAMSKSRFCKFFRNTTGYTFNKYLNICRIRKAAEYIKNGYKITAIYGLCGYNDFTTFYRNFKDIMGVSPREYKSNIELN